jgi:hypothetical protein
MADSLSVILCGTLVRGFFPQLGFSRHIQLREDTIAHGFDSTCTVVGFLDVKNIFLLCYPVRPVPIDGIFGNPRV